MSAVVDGDMVFLGMDGVDVVVPMDTCREVVDGKRESEGAEVVACADIEREAIVAFEDVVGHGGFAVGVEGGDTCQAANYINKKTTFGSLFSGAYLPFTYKEWLGEDPIEVPEVKYSHTGDSIELSKVFNSKVTCNYHIYDIYIEIYDAAGNEVAKVATHNNGASEYELKFMRTGEQAYVWGDLDKLDASKSYTAKVYCQLGTGERPTLWEGKLIVD